MTRPKFKYHLIQSRLRDRLKALAGPWKLSWNMRSPFRALPEHELRVADAAFVRPERVSQIDPDDNLRGAPDLVIEILSPSKTPQPQATVT